MEKSNDNGKIIGAALIGAVVGAGLGILFAPAKGSETRKNIMAKGGEIKDAIKDKYESIVGE